MEIRQHISQTLSNLKDFQRNTVENALINFHNHQNRFLIADEVGLGKTIVAKGIVARLYLEAFEKGNDFQVIYVCSNKALAKQNLKKLVPFSHKINGIDIDQVIDFSEEDDRLTFLAYEDRIKENPLRLKIKALTPNTSFDTNRSAGKKDERILIYRILSKTEYFKTRKIALKWFLRGFVQEDNWERDIEFQTRSIKDDVYEKFIHTLREEISHQFFNEIKNAYSSINKNIETLNSLSFLEILQCIILENKRGRNTQDYIPNSTIVNKIIGEIRIRLASACKEYLKADLFILDEFQRFNKILTSSDIHDNPSIQLARQIFDKKDSKLLLLSATPFKAYSTHYESLHGEDHYQEFKSVLEFLLPNFNTNEWENLDKMNHEYFEGLKSIEKVTQLDDHLLNIKNNIESIYKRAISRTERNLVEIHNNEQQNDIRKLTIQESDLRDFLAFDKIIQHLNDECKARLSIPIEYAKSSPYPFSFLAEYEHFKVLQKHFQENKKLRSLVKKAKNAFIHREKIEDFKPLIPERSTVEPNPKLRLLYDDVRSHGWNLLWLPPTLPYYKVNKGPYKGYSFQENKDFSKTLIFSAWKMVPRMVSTLVSYEAERLSIGEFLKNHTRSQEEFSIKKDSNRHISPLWVYKNEDSTHTMMNFSLTYPCPYLANLIDPVLNIKEQLTLSELINKIKQTIKNHLREIAVHEIGSVNGNKKNWQWYAMLLLDKHSNQIDVRNWFESYHLDKNKHTHQKSEENNQVIYQFQHHFEHSEIEDSLLKLSDKDVDELSEYLAHMSLGSPAICAYRALKRIFPEDKYLIKHAHSIANNFRTLFNKQESISIVRIHFEQIGYYNNVIEYCINGNIQSMLDEFFYQLNDSAGIYQCDKLIEYVNEIFSMPISSLDVKNIESIAEDKKDLKMRVHYAMPFGMKSQSDDKSESRNIKVREAFNSPFRPFVLTSTSIGQEGLDFHYYCDKIIHWNLPHNPIDLEQREGRIKRYKGYNIRKKIIQNLNLNEIEIHPKENIWKTIYHTVENKKIGKCDLIPFWYYPDKENSTSIKAIFPIYPYSKDHEKLRYIKNVLGNYRLAFGQPRQEELMYLLGDNSSDEAYKNKLKQFLINLCPTSWDNK